MADVAQRAGVSQTTVSYVVNDTPHIRLPDETRQRVWEAVRELGWRPNAVARSLSKRRSHTIGFLSDEIATLPYAGHIIRGAQAAAWARDTLLLVISTDGDRHLEQRGFALLLERQVDALIYATMYHRAVTLPPIDPEIPLVLLNCFAADGSTPSVVPDEVQGGRAAAEALLTCGHRRIGFLNTHDPIPAAVGRLEGYRTALAAAKLPFEPQLVRSAGTDAAEGYRCTLELLQLPERPTALVCFKDVMAIGAYEAVKQLGLHIPDDVAIVSFDNLEVIAPQLFPPLATMALPHYEMGMWSVNYLLDPPGTPLGSPVHQRLPYRLIERESLIAAGRA
ncbi:MAG: substrate-binding domain-containing protein [Chloroflexales bacterium]|nr:substrate-binding domain-containing protein [Chloroflexales bacterium]